MANDRLPLATRQDITRCRLFVHLLDQWPPSGSCAARLAYAQAQHKPIRLLRWPGVRLPEDALLGIADLQVAMHGTQAEDMAQIQRWLAEVPHA